MAGKSCRRARGEHVAQIFRGNHKHLNAKASLIPQLNSNNSFLLKNNHIINDMTFPYPFSSNAAVIFPIASSTTSIIAA